jgi:integrase
MSRELNRLSPKFVEAISKPGRYADGGGLYLQVSAGKNGAVTKSWLFRYMRGGATSREMGLGALSTNRRDGLITTKEARDRAFAARETLKAGLDPIDARKAGKAAEKLDRARSITFTQSAEQYIKEHEAGWKGKKHAKLWRGSLKKYVYPVFGDLSVAAIDTALVLKAVKPIWETKTKTAMDVRLRIELVLDSAKIHGSRAGENPARWKGHLDHALPKPSKITKVAHLAALPYDELPAFMGELRKKTDTASAALDWTILAAARTDDTRGAVWSEIDVDKKVWTIPAARMKAASDHRVPLTERMLEILDRLPNKGSRFVFPAKNPDKKLPHEWMLKALKAIRTSMTVHGFRSTFRDWAAEQTAYPNEVVEMALAHKISSKVEAAYRRGDLFEKRQRLMADWMRYCVSTPITRSNVVTLRGDSAS